MPVDGAGMFVGLVVGEEADVEGLVSDAAAAVCVAEENVVRDVDVCEVKVIVEVALESVVVVT